MTKKKMYLSQGVQNALDDIIKEASSNNQTSLIGYVVDKGIEDYQLFMGSAKSSMISGQMKHDAVASKGYDLTCQHFYSMVGTSNYIAYTYMIELMDEFEDMGKLKFNAKVYAKKADNIYQSYYHKVKDVFMLADANMEKNAYDILMKADAEHKEEAEKNYNAIVGRRGNRMHLFSNLTVAMDSLVGDAKENLRDKIYNLLVKKDVKGDLVMLSKVILSEELMILAIGNYDAFFDTSAEEWCDGQNFKMMFAGARLHDMLKWWQMAITLMIDLPKGIDLQKDYECRKARKKLMRAEMSGAKMNKAADKAISYDPELEERVNNGEFDKPEDKEV